MTPLSHDSALSMALLSHASEVSLTPLSQWKSTFVYDLAPWLSCVNDVAESKLRDVIDTAESKLSSVIDTALLSQWRHRWVNFINLKGSNFLKRQPTKIQARVNFNTLRLWGKSLKNVGCLRKFLWLSGFIDTSESTLSWNISVNSKLFVKTLQGVKQWPRGRCLREKPEVKNLVRLSL
jgi:hypothetical protein